MKTLLTWDKGFDALTEDIRGLAGFGRDNWSERPMRFTAGGDTIVTLATLRSGNGKPIYDPVAGTFMTRPIKFEDGPAMAGRLMIEVRALEPAPLDTSNQAIVALLGQIVERLDRIENLADKQEHRRQQAINDANEW